MNYKMILHVLGRILMVEAAFLLIPLGISIYQQDSAMWSFVITLGLLIAVGLPLTLKKPKNQVFYSVSWCFILFCVFLNHKIS